MRKECGADAQRLDKEMREDMEQHRPRLAALSRIDTMQSEEWRESGENEPVSRSPAAKRGADCGAVLLPAALPSTIECAYEAQCHQLCFGAYPSWDGVQTRFLDFRVLLLIIESRIIYRQSKQREDCFQKAVIKRGLRRMRRSA